MSMKGCFAFRQRRLASQDLSSPLLMKKEKRIIKSGDDAYSTDVVIISNCFIFIEYSCI